MKIVVILVDGMGVQQLIREDLIGIYRSKYLQLQEGHTTQRLKKLLYIFVAFPSSF
jgi:hypothetical protein